MPTLEQSVLSTKARREVDMIKSLISEERERTATLSRSIRDARIKAFSSSSSKASGLCRPDELVLFIFFLSLSTSNRRIEKL